MELRCELEHDCRVNVAGQNFHPNGQLIQNQYTNGKDFNIYQKNQLMIQLPPIICLPHLSALFQISVSFQSCDTYALNPILFLNSVNF